MPPASFGVEQFDVLTGFKFVGELIQQFEETAATSFCSGLKKASATSQAHRCDKDGVNARH